MRNQLKRLFFTAITIILTTITLKAQTPPIEGSWEIIPELTDEFEGEYLNINKWFDHDPDWKGRIPAYFLSDNVSVVDGELQLASRVGAEQELPDGYFITGSAIKSTVEVLYGYFEVKAKAVNSLMSSAFWFYKYTENPKAGVEIDVFEMSPHTKGREKAISMNVHTFHTPNDSTYRWCGTEWEASFNLSDDYHIYALEWNEENIVFLVDNEVVYTCENVDQHFPMQMMFSSETMESRTGIIKYNDLSTYPALPGIFKIEYVRSWKRK